MDKNVDQCSAVECTAAHPRLTKSLKEEEKSLYVFFCIGASISIGREIRCLPYEGFFSSTNPKVFGGFAFRIFWKCYAIDFIDQIQVRVL